MKRGQKTPKRFDRKSVAKAKLKALTQAQAQTIKEKRAKLRQQRQRLKEIGQEIGPPLQRLKLIDEVWQHSPEFRAALAEDQRTLTPEELERENRALERMKPRNRALLRSPLK